MWKPIRMTDFILEQYNICDTIVRTLLQYSPIWCTTGFQRFAKHFLPFYTTVIGTVIGVAIVDKAFKASDMGTVTECLIPAAALITLPFKLMTPVIYKHTFLEIYEQLDSDLRLYRTSNATETLNKTNIKIFSVSMKFMSICYKILLFSYVVAPLLVNLYQLIGNIRPLNLAFPYPASYPEIFTSNAIVFVVVYLLETLDVVVGASISLGDDAFFGLVVFQMITIMNMLSNRVLNAEGDIEHFSTLRECIDKHCQLMNFAHRLEPIYGPIVLSQRLTDAILLCAVIYQMNQVADFDLSRVLIFSTWILVKYLQILTCAWYGSMLITESENLSNTIYSCKWPDFYNRKFMSNITHVLQQKPIAINVFGFFIISIPMASSIITASFSYFFLLRSFEKEE